MAGVGVDIRLKSIDNYITKAHGSPRALAPDEVELLSFWMGVVIQYIRNRWPVETGTSRDRWNFHLNPTPGQMGIVIENPMYYAEFVHRKGESGELWRSLIPEAWNAVKVLALAALRKKIDENEAKIKRLQLRFPGRSLREITLDLFRGVEA